MQYILTEVEMQEYKQAQKDIASRDAMLTGAMATVQRLKTHNNNLVADLKRLGGGHYRMQSAIVNLGTYDKETAKKIADGLGEMRSNTKLGTHKIKYIRNRGRGCRRINNRNYDQSIPIALAEKVAIYIELE